MSSSPAPPRRKPLKQRSMKRPDNNGAKKTKREKGRHRRKDEGQAKGRSRHEGNIDEDDGDIAAEIEMDEPERFQSDTRLRHRGETSYQRKLRKLKNKRRGIVESSTEESSSDEDSDSDDSDDSQDFLTDSGESLAEGVMPAEFSLNAAQTTEFKFKVTQLDQPKDHCDACNRHKQHCYNQVALGGFPYDKDSHQMVDDSDSDDEELDPMHMGRHCKTIAQLYHALCHWEDNLYHRICGYYRDLLRAKHKPVPSDSEASTSSGPDSESDPEEQQVRRQDRERRRARTQQRVRKLRQRGPLPKEYRDVDRVTEWMDTVGYQNKDYRWFQDLEEQCRLLEADNSRD
ncbi:uncharacterized protein EHS24_009678 [Apiotrichum porosum]|uniref:DUF4211 domain-containing protein n=1 Tax=Apiotrichum porosum TaxID=105984 RepID=A0A427XMR3_9TREE|nr:uncharacterized protein EHS24_009678 [Apiotrichum porosum]RSH80007.1 hypothetical protein EHS24_009678 [Apiotrichum porosum]